MIQVSGADIQGIMPLLISSGFAIVILLLDAFQKPTSSRGYLSTFAVLGLVLTGIAAYVLWHQRTAYELFGGMAYLDGFGQAMTVTFVVAGILTCLLAPEFLRSQGVDRGEFYALVLFAVTGMILVAVAGDLITLFLGLETMSIALYALAGFFRHSRESAEASLKYLILGAFSTGLLLFGIALVYGSTGSTDLSEVGRHFAGAPVALSPELRAVLAPAGDLAVCQALQGGAIREVVSFCAALSPGDPAVSLVSNGQLLPIPFLGMVLILVSFGFKIAAAPFHMWAPDVYTGTPTPAVGFMATAVKAAGFAAFLRVFGVAFFGDAARNSPTGWVQIIFALCLLTMVVGNLGAIVQTRVKRMLAYSSVAHAGYILVAFTAAGYSATQGFNSAVIFYLVAYTFGTVGAFGVLTYLGRRGEEVDTYEDLNELGFKYPWLGFAMAVFMLSAAGIPPTAGFLAKFLVFKAAIDASVFAGGGPAPALMIILATVGILASVAGVYYYLKVIVHMYMRRATRTIRALPNRGAAFALAVCVIATLGLGLLPSRLNGYSLAASHRLADAPDGPVARELPYLQPEQAGWQGDDGPTDTVPR